MTPPTHLTRFSGTLLNALLRGEIAAVECYLVAFGAAPPEERRRHRLRLRLHRDRIQVLRSRIEAHGGTPCECSGPWITLTRAATVVASCFGGHGRRLAMAVGEALGDLIYRTALLIADRDTRDFLHNRLLTSPVPSRFLLDPDDLVDPPGPLPDPPAGAAANDGDLSAIPNDRPVGPTEPWSDGADREGRNQRSSPRMAGPATPRSARALRGAP